MHGLRRTDSLLIQGVRLDRYDRQIKEYFPFLPRMQGVGWLREKMVEPLA